MVTIIPDFYRCKLIFPLCICQDLVHFFLCKSKVFIQAGIRDRIKNKIIGSGKNTLFRYTRTSD